MEKNRYSTYKRVGLQENNTPRAKQAFWKARRVCLESFAESTMIPKENVIIKN
jgi:hypothetical protein